ncbi:sentrin-specific protease 6-like [Salminus brasiliensis]|uniref:sentrin-specific protease 6-like n=1 Tax=Salminus brasiliensis TaxID=930266 RepID=UPI003B83707F
MFFFSSHRDLSQTMTHCRQHRNRVALAVDRFAPPSPPGVVLQRRHFHHALGRDSTEVAQHAVSDEIVQIAEDGPVVNHGSTNSEEQIYHTDEPYLVKRPRKCRMRDQFGDVVPIKRKTKSQPTITRFLPLKWDVVEGYNTITLNIRSFKLGTLNMNFRGTATFSVDYIEIPDKARIVASEIISCEWCTEHELPALFLETTAAEWLCLGDLNLGQKEKYIVIIFESEPTMLEKAVLEEIFAEIGRRNNISNFSAILTFSEASDRLMACKQSHKNEEVLLLDEVDENPSRQFISEVTITNRKEEKEVRSKLVKKGYYIKTD